MPDEGKWPCFFTYSDTTGEKDIEEFFMGNETLDMFRFNDLGIIKNELDFDNQSLDEFIQFIEKCKFAKHWTKNQIIAAFQKLIPDFDHKETGKYLDGKM